MTDWEARTTAVPAVTGEPLEIVHQHQRTVRIPELARLLRATDGLFCCAEIERDRRGESVDELGRRASARGRISSLQRRTLDRDLAAPDGTGEPRRHVPRVVRV